MARCPSCRTELPAGAVVCPLCAGSSSIAATVAIGPATDSAFEDEGRFPAGTILAQRYRITGLLGRGGMGEVYKANDLLLGQTVALKFLPASLATNEAMLERFRAEVRTARQVSHPNVCRVYDLGEVAGDLFLTMEFIDGEDLKSLLLRVGHPTQAKAIEMARRICAGLHAAHERGVLHRDLKPANIMIDRRGQVRIVDFGLASAGQQFAGDVHSGTPAYMSPEQLAGRPATAVSDIYALGLVLHEMFTGRRAFEAASVSELASMQQSGVDPPAQLDPSIARTITRCLDPDPRRRPPTALSVAAALPGADPLQAALEAGETPSPDLVAASGERTGIGLRTGLACLGVLLAALLATAWFAPRGDVFRQQPAELPPDALALRARDLLTSFDYTGRTANAAFNFDYDTSGRLHATPPPVFFWYRSDPQPLTPWLQRTMPAENDPPPAPGTVVVRLDTSGRLVRLKAFPPAAEPPAAARAFDWKRLFEAAGLDPARFVEVPPQLAPWSPVDQRVAWIERDSADPLQVEAAAWRGRPVAFQLARTGASQASLASPNVSAALLDLFLLVTVAGSCALAWRNVRSGRGDRRGALRLGLFMLPVLLICGVLPVGRFDTLQTYNLFSKYAGWCLYWSAVTVIPYLAIEPYVRRNWPHVLISWTRLIGGEWRDPLVGRDVLAGMAAGAVMGAIVEFYLTIHGPLTYDAWATMCNLISGPGQLTTLLLVQFLWGVPVNLLAFFLLFAYSMATGRRWAGALLYVSTMAPIWAAPSAHPGLSAIAYTIVATISMGVFLRFGILAGGSMFLIFQTCIHAPITSNASAWYFGESLAIIAVLMLAGFVAFRVAVRST